MRKYGLLLYLCCAWSGILLAQNELLQSGPMLGYSEMREVLLWVQTTEAADVHFTYTPQGQRRPLVQTEVYRTNKAGAYTARLLADQVEPGLTYDYQLFINGKAVPLPYPTIFQTQTLWQWRTDPPPFTLALGSCSYVGEEAYDRPGEPYGGNYEIFTEIHKHQPDAMLWLGDNVYLREADWNSRTGIIKRYTHTRSLAELQPLLASTHHYAVWDDHDYGPNDSDRSYLHKDKTLETFQLFWGNPTYGFPHQAGGITSAFQWQDMDFFLLDNRYFRSPNRREVGDSTILGHTQLEWLIDALIGSRAPFKFVAIGGQVLNTAEVYETYSNLAPRERAYLLRRIEEEKITGVVFLTGDRHHTELSSYENGNGHMVYDLTVSPLTSGSGRNRDEVNELREENTLVVERNFGLLSFSGPRKEREMLIQIFNVDGEELWQRKVAAPRR